MSSKLNGVDYAKNELPALTLNFSDVEEEGDGTPRTLSEDALPVLKNLKNGRRKRSVSFHSARHMIQGLRVLYVEDSPLFHAGMGEVARVFKWNLTIASTGQEGVALAKQYQFNLVLMDGNLGVKSDFDGFECARRIKAFAPNLVILSFSAELNKGEKGDAMDGHLKKSTNWQYFKRALVPYLPRIMQRKSS